MAAENHDPVEDDVRSTLKSSESTAFYMWLLITVSAGIIMAQDTWVSVQQPRLSTVDATAAFTKVMVIHGIWLVATIAFLIFTWYVRPTSAWKVHIAVGVVTACWTISVLGYSFADVERLRVSTWHCESAPTTATVDQSFLDTCEHTDTGRTIRLGGDIYLWSTDNEHYWRWIVPGEGLATLQTQWPSEVSAVYLGSNGDNPELTDGSLDSVPGGNWSARFDPRQSLDLHIYFIEEPADSPFEDATPESVGYHHVTEFMHHAGSSRTG